MGKDEYATAGGALKLKGAKNAGIDKKRKRKKEQTPAQPTENKQTNPAENQLQTSTQSHTGKTWP